MYFWLTGEVQCSGKLEGVKDCPNTFWARLQLCISNKFNTDEPTAVTRVDGQPPAGWATIKKEYYSTPHYFCPDCHKQALRL